MFPSVGDAAGFEKFCRQIQFKLSNNVACTGVSDNYPFPMQNDDSGMTSQTIQQQSHVNVNIVQHNLYCSYLCPGAVMKGCVVFVNAKNNVGDPVIDTIKRIVENNSHMTNVLLNCDLSDKASCRYQYQCKLYQIILYH